MHLNDKQVEASEATETFQTLYKNSILPPGRNPIRPLKWPQFFMAWILKNGNIPLRSWKSLFLPHPKGMLLGSDLVTGQATETHV